MIGILSDSHDNLPMIGRAVRVFNDAGCDLVIHAGDIVAPFAARALAGLRAPIKAVFGNCDGERKGLEEALSGLGAHPLPGLRQGSQLKHRTEKFHPYLHPAIR